MLKNFLILLLILIGFSGISLSAGEKDSYNKAQKDYEEKVYNYTRAESEYTSIIGNIQNQTELDKIGKEAAANIPSLYEEIEPAKEKYIKAKEAYDNSPESKNDFTSRGFKLTVGDIFPGNRYTDDSKNMVENTNLFFGDIIQKLLVGLGAFALFIMTVGAGFMIFYHGEDNLLTKGKSIFSAGIISLIVAIMSFYMIEFVKYLLDN